MDPVTNELHEMTEDVKSRKEMNRHYMKSWEWERMIWREGREEGREKTIIDLILRKQAKGKSEEQIAEELAEELGEAPEHVTAICRVIKKLGAATDTDAVYEAMQEEAEATVL